MMTEKYAVGRTQVLAAQTIRVDGAGAQTMFSVSLAFGIWHLGKVSGSQKVGGAGDMPRLMSYSKVSYFTPYKVK